ncbi:MAG: hypothetical protein AB7K24_10565 [Gemmataceae bacterium]
MLHLQSQIRQLEELEKSTSGDLEALARMRARMESTLLEGILNPRPARGRIYPVADLVVPMSKVLTASAHKPAVWKRDARQPTFARVYVGDGNALELVSLHVSVSVDGPRARTVVDHIFRNPHERQLEGTFEYPLPTGASPSYYAMFLGPRRDQPPPRFARQGDTPPLPENALAALPPEQLVLNVNTKDWGELRLGRVFPKQRAAEVYEEIVRGKIDPALLEYAGGNTFSGRVFPIAPKGYNRIIIAYEELLPVVQQQCVYRFELPDGKLQEIRFTLQANAAEAKEPVFTPETPAGSVRAGKLSYARAWQDQGPGGAATFRFTPAQPGIQAIAGQQDLGGPHYLYARVRPDLEVEAARPFARHAVFLLDVSQSEQPARFGVNMKLLRKILESDDSISHFNVLAFNVGASWLEPAGWIANNAAGRDKVFAKLDGIVLEGATDLSAALDKLSAGKSLVGTNTPVNLFLLSDGQVTWGEPEVTALTARFETKCRFPYRFHCYRIGLGAENQQLFAALTRKGGGVFQCYGEADVTAAARAHRSHCFQVERVTIPGASDVLIAGRQAAIYPGGELIVAGKVAQPGATSVVIEGTFLGKKERREFKVTAAESELAPRAWGEIAVAALTALDDPKLDPLVTAYCQQFSIGSSVASFLVLESDNDYKRFNLQEENGKILKEGGVAGFLADAWREAGQLLTPRQMLERFLARIEPRLKLKESKQADHVKKLLELLTDSDLDIGSEPLDCSLVEYRDLPAAYLKARRAEPRAVQPFLAEAERRLEAGDTGGALRVLSSVIEDYPARPDALRLVGYRLVDMKLPGHAAVLFQQVERNRPFEPHSYRDLARALEESGKYGLAALHYELLLAGSWDSRFRQDLAVVAREEYARMMQQAIRNKRVSRELADLFGTRLEQMIEPAPKSDLRVTISWNTDATDVDLWVIEPDGERCYYQNPKTKSGGQLSQDQTQGYGPERYQIAKAPPGEYVIVVHYYRANINLLAGESHVNVVLTRNAGSPQETTERRTVVLRKSEEVLEVCRVKK